MAIVDYKAKATKNEITLDPKRKKNGEIVKTERYLISYVKQIEFYQWLFRMNGFKVSNTGYFLFANAQKERDCFDDRLTFEKVLIAHQGDDSWVEPTLMQISECLKSPDLPKPGDECEHCDYRRRAQAVEVEQDSEGASPSELSWSIWGIPTSLLNRDKSKC